MRGFGDYELDENSSALKARDYKDATDLVIQPTVFYGNRVADIRIQDDKVNTLQARMGTGGNNMPMVAYPIDDAREIEKKQNGLGIGKAGAPAYTVDTVSRQGVAVTQSFVKAARARSADDAESWREDGVSPTLNVFDNTGEARATVVNIMSPTIMRQREGKPGGGKGPMLSDRSFTIATNNDQTLFESSTVRRLTPTECERLQGFPDGWTSERFDEKKDAVVVQADSNRYKQMGNAVAVPVVEWIISRLVEQHR